MRMVSKTGNVMQPGQFTNQNIPTPWIYQENGSGSSKKSVHLPMKHQKTLC